MVTGVTVTQVRDGIYLVDVVVRANDEQRCRSRRCASLQLPLPNGRTVPLSQFATFDFGQEYPLVWRRDRVPTLTVQADVAPARRPTTVVQTLAPEIAKLKASLPSGYHIESAARSRRAARRRPRSSPWCPLMLFLMLTVLMIQLQSFSRLFLVLSVVPLGLIGVVAALLLSDKPLGFVAHPRHSRADRHDRPQRGDPDRPDRDREGAGAASLGRGRRGDHARFRPIMLTAIRRVSA